jgi:hypothetical protein
MLRRSRLGLGTGRKKLVFQEFEPPVRFVFLTRRKAISTEARTCQYRIASSCKRRSGSCCQVPFFAVASAGGSAVDAAATGLDRPADGLGRRTDHENTLRERLRGRERSASALAVGGIVWRLHVGFGQSLRSRARRPDPAFSAADAGHGWPVLDGSRLDGLRRRRHAAETPTPSPTRKDWAARAKKKPLRRCS